MQEKTVITEYTIGEKYEKYKNEDFLSIDSRTCYEYGVDHRNNVYYPEDAEAKFEFLGKEVKRLAFDTTEEGIIKGMVLFLDVYDIDNFYVSLEEEYGQAQTTRISSTYLKEKGYVIPTEVDSTHTDYYKDLPEPTVMDYKSLNGVAWYDLKTSLKESTETNLYIRNSVPNTVMGESKYTVELKFRISKPKN